MTKKTLKLKWVKDVKNKKLCLADQKNCFIFSFYDEDKGFYKWKISDNLRRYLGLPFIYESISLEDFILKLEAGHEDKLMERQRRREHMAKEESFRDKAFNDLPFSIPEKCGSRYD